MLALFPRQESASLKHSLVCTVSKEVGHRPVQRYRAASLCCVRWDFQSTKT